MASCIHKASLHQNDPAQRQLMSSAGPVEVRLNSDKTRVEKTRQQSIMHSE